MLFLTFLSASGDTQGAQIACERIETVAIWFDVGSYKACFIDTTTPINAIGVTIGARDESIGALHMYNNPNILKLPEKVAETFPNLAVYSAAITKTDTIAKHHFQNLSKLRLIDLAVCKIEQINSDTFEDLLALELIRLSEWTKKSDF